MRRRRGPGSARPKNSSPIGTNKTARPADYLAGCGRLSGRLANADRLVRTAARLPQLPGRSHRRCGFSGRAVSGTAGRITGEMVRWCFKKRPSRGRGRPPIGPTPRELGVKILRVLVDNHVNCESVKAEIPLSQCVRHGLADATACR